MHYNLEKCSRVGEIKIKYLVAESRGRHTAEFPGLIVEESGVLRFCCL